LARSVDNGGGSTSGAAQFVANQIDGGLSKAGRTPSNRRFAPNLSTGGNSTLKQRGEFRANGVFFFGSLERASELTEYFKLPRHY
jgi:hypothetical protein